MSAPRQLIFNFHGLGEPPAHVEAAERPYWIPVERFNEIARLIRSQSTEGRVAITFDDGNASDRDHALPILKAYGLRATFFVLSEFVGRPGYLSADDIKALSSAGMAIGSHGRRHQDWTTLRDELATEVRTSLASLSDIVGHGFTEVAVPFGRYDLRVLAVLRQCGVSRVYTSDNGLARAGAWLVPRNTVRVDTPLGAIEEMVDNGFPASRRMRMNIGWMVRQARQLPGALFGRGASG